MKILVNLITTSRIIFSFVLLTLIRNLNRYLLIFLIALLFFTDFLDGFLARKFKVQTLYGSTMDTIADKILSIILVVPLVSDINILILILLGEILIAVLNIIGKVKGKHTCSSKMGKLKMWLLAITVILGYGYFFDCINYYFIMISCLFTFCIQCYVGVEYYRYLKKQTSSKNETKYKIKDYKSLFYVLFDTKYFLECIQSQD